MISKAKSSYNRRIMEENSNDPKNFCCQARSTNTELHWSRYKRLRNQVTAMISKAKSSYNRRIMEENSNDPKNFWKAV